MQQEKKLKPMSNSSFRAMNWTFNFIDFFLRPFSNPARRLKKVPLKEGLIVVDYACGPGRYTIPLAGLVGPAGKVYAVDIQPLAIETVKKKASRKSLTNIEAILVDSYHTGLPDSSADIVLLVDAIQGIKEYADLFREINRLLKPAGFLFMDSGHMSTSAVIAILEKTGFFKMVKLDGKNMLLSKKQSR